MSQSLMIILFSGGQCEDQHKHCKNWAENDHCSLSPDPMLTTCPKSCGACSEECKDEEAYRSDCPAWADYGYCLRTVKNSNILKFMLKNCKKSCGVCTPGIDLKNLICYNPCTRYSTLFKITTLSYMATVCQLKRMQFLPVW